MCCVNDQSKCNSVVKSPATSYSLQLYAPSIFAKTPAGFPSTEDVTLNSMMSFPSMARLRVTEKTNRIVQDSQSHLHSFWILALWPKLIVEKLTLWHIKKILTLTIKGNVSHRFQSLHNRNNVISFGPVLRTLPINGCDRSVGTKVKRERENYAKIANSRHILEYTKTRKILSFPLH